MARGRAAETRARSGRSATSITRCTRMPPATVVGRPARPARADLRQVRRQCGVLRPRPRLRATQAAEGHLLLRVGCGGPAAKRQHETRRTRLPRRSIRTRASCSSRSPATTCLPGDLAHRQDRRFRRDPSDGPLMDSRRHTGARHGAGCAIACERPFHACRDSPWSTCCCCRWARDRPGVGQYGARELLPLHLRDRVRRQRRRDDVLLRADDQGGRRSHGAGRRAPSVAARAAAGHCVDRRHGRSRAASTSAWSRCSTSRCWRSAGRCHSRPISPSAISSRESSSGRIRRSRFCCCSAIASDVLGFLALAVFNPTGDLHLAGRRADHGGRDRASPSGCGGHASEASGRICSPPAASRGTRSSGAACIRRSRSCRSCPFLPHAARDPGFFVDALPDREGHAESIRGLVEISRPGRLFFFGLVNAGVPLHALEAGTLGMPIAVIVGKPLGVLVGGRPSPRRPACTCRTRSAGAN